MAKRDKKSEGREGWRTVVKEKGGGGGEGKGRDGGGGVKEKREREREIERERHVTGRGTYMRLILPADNHQQRHMLARIIGVDDP